MKSLVKIFAAMFLVFSLSGVALAKDEKGAMVVKPEMQFSLVCENEQVSMTFMSLESGIIEKAVKKAGINTDAHEVALTVVSEDAGIIIKRTGKDVMHETVAFKNLRVGRYKIIVNYRDNITTQEFEVK
jgi:hypothetical protein